MPKHSGIPKYAGVIQQTIELVARHGRAEIHWHPLSGGPTVRTGLGKFKGERVFSDNCLIGVYTEAPHPKQVVEDIEAYRAGRAA